MGQLVVIRNHQIVQEVSVDTADITCGRSSEAQITLDDPAVSRWHLRIVTEAGQVIMEDTDSTNGTRVNGELTRRTPLADGDVITVGDYQLQYRDAGRRAGNGGGQWGEASATASEAGNDDPPAASPDTAGDAGPAGTRAAVLEILSGKHQGRQLTLDKATTHIGRGGQLVAVVNRRPDGFFLVHAEAGPAADVILTVNDGPLPPDGLQLQRNDRICVGDVDMRFIDL